MFQRSATRRNVYQTGANFLASTLLLVLYLAGNIQSDAIHQLLHAHEAVSHSIEDEGNACHRSIYHDDTTAGCVHNTHITRLEKCGLSHVIVHSDQLATTDSSCEFIGTAEDNEAGSVSLALSDISVTLPSRAPPSI